MLGGFYVFCFGLGSSFSSVSLLLLGVGFLLFSWFLGCMLVGIFLL